MAAGPTCLVPGDYSTIQGAVNDANCSTISLLSATFTENVTISRAVTIVGMGNDPSGGKNASIVTAPAAGGSVFTIQLPSSGNIIIVTIQNLQITGGHATYGAGINNVGATVMLSNVVITGNRADKNGGGIYNAGGGKLSLASSVVSANKAGLAGAGIYNSADLSTQLFDHVPTQGEVENELTGFISTFPDLFSGGATFIQQFQVVPFNLLQTFNQEIQTKVDPTALHDQGSSPASLFINYAIFTVTFVGNSQITGNTVDGSYPSVPPMGFGGGILNELGVVVVADSSSVDNNSVTANGIAAGGGILSFGLTGIYNSTITKNSAMPNGQIKLPAFGGGIANVLGRLNIGDATASSEVVNVTNNTLNSTVASLGAGIESVFGSSYIYFAHIDNNSIPTNTNGGFVRGAGISSDAVPIPVVNQLVFTPEVHLFDSTVNGNSIGTTLGTAEGGAILNRSELDLTRVTVSGNTATSTIGNAQGAGIWSGNGSLNISKSTLSGNTATSGLLVPVPDSAQGGGIYSEGTNVNISQSTIAGNSVVSQSTPTLKSYAQGGAIFFQPLPAPATSTPLSGYPSLTIDASTIVNNSVSAICSGCGSTNPAVVQEGGIMAFPQTVSSLPITLMYIYGSILAQNTGGSCKVAPNNITPTDSGNNLSDDPPCNAAVSTSNPQLIGLGNFGGPTQTYMPLPNSPARNAGYPVGSPHCFADDQSGAAHRGTGPCDIGSMQGPPFLVTALSAQSASATTVTTTGPISATFSLGLDPTTALASNVSVLSKFQGQLSASVSYDATSQTLSIQPSRPLIVGDTIATLLTPNLKSTDGRPLVPFQKQFTVQGAPFCASNSFQQVTTNLPNVEFGSIEWADYDGDGKLDAVVTGVTGVTFDTNFPYGPIYTYVTDVYHNDGNGHFTPINAGITPVGFGNAVWGDYDGDGKPDLLVMGRKQTHYLLPANDGNPNDSIITGPGTSFAAVYHNNGDGTFTKVQEFTGFENGQAAWVDLTNDGKLDIVLVGVTYGNVSPLPSVSTMPTASKIYRNDGGTFTDMGSLPIFNTADVAIADYDSDGRMDFSVGGYAFTPFSGIAGSGLYGSPLTNIYHNLTGGISPLFPNTNGPLPELRFGSMDWADVDGDGKPDLLLSGESVPTNGPPVPFTDVFKNNGDGTFTALNAGLPAVSDSSVRFGDYDNDGHPDILITGLTSGGFNQGTTTVFHNDGTGHFTQTASLAPGVSYSYASWADMNGDGKLEFAVTGTPTTGGSMLTQIFTPASCQGADVSYTTPKNAVLSVPAPGLIANASSERTVTGVAVATPPANGTLTAFPGDGSFVYTPNAGFSGVDTFTYNVKDSVGTSTDAATVTITVLTQPISCWATPDGGTTVFQGINGAPVQQAIDAAAVGATVRIAGYCAGTQSRGGDSQTAYISKNLMLDGGYTAANWSVSSPASNLTTLDAVSTGHAVNITTGVTVVVSDLTLTGGATANGGGVQNAGSTTLSNVIITSNTAINGGGVANTGTLTLTGSQLSANTAASGGGLWNSGAAASATIANSTVAGNLAHGNGGAVFNAQSAMFNLSASTLTSNQAGGNGAALDNETSGGITVVNSTLVGNVAGGTGGAGSATGGASTLVKSSTINGNNAVRGGGFSAQSGSTSFVNTINVKNSNGDCSGPVTSLGHNIDTDLSCNFHATGDLSKDPQLQPLGSNGGPTQTEALSFTSSAIDKGDNTQCPSTDQRGMPRPAGSVCDIGAVEQTVPGAGAMNDAYAAAAGVPLNINAASGVLANDFSEDGSTLTAQLVTSTAHGTLNLNANGSFSYLASPTFSGTDSFTYTAKNDLTTSTAATVTITVAPALACSATSDGVTVFSTADATALRQAVAGAPTGGTVKIAGTCAGTTTVHSSVDGVDLSATLLINHSVTLQGGYIAGQWTQTPDPVANPTIIDGNGSGRVIQAEPQIPGDLPALVNITVDGLTIQNGNVNGGSSPNGGGIRARGVNLTLSRTNVSGNKTTAQGGGIDVDGMLVKYTKYYNSTPGPTALTFQMVSATDGVTPVTGLVDGQFVKTIATDAAPLVTLQGGISEVPTNPGTYTIPLFFQQMIGATNATIHFAAPGARSLDLLLAVIVTSDLVETVPTSLSLTAGSSVSGNTAGGDAGGINIESYSETVSLNAYDAQPQVSLTDSTVSGNQAGGAGGGIRLQTDPPQGVHNTMTLNRSTISGNSANQGAGIYSSGTFNITNSTISSNNANTTGGGLEQDSTATTTVTSSTIAFNVGKTGRGGYSMAGGSILFQNSLVAKNVPTDCGLNSAQHTTSNGGNVDSDASCFAVGAVTQVQPSDKTIYDPGLLTLANNGGLTQTDALSPTSSAINIGLNCVTTDQRGAARLRAPATCDPGAYELAPSVGARDDSYRVQRNQTTAITAANGVLANDSATQSGALTAQLVAGPSHGTLTLNSDGSFSYTPTSNYLGPDSFTYVAQQSGLTSNTANVSLTVVPLATCAATIDGTTVYSSNDYTALQQAINAAPSGGTVKVAGVCTGVASQPPVKLLVMTQTAYINKPLTLVGGYDGTNWNATPDPVLNPTILDAKGQGGTVGVFGTSVNMPVTLKNLVMTNSNGQPNVMILGAIATITNFDINNGVSDQDGAGLHLEASLDPTQTITYPVGLTLSNGSVRNNRTSNAGGGLSQSTGTTIMTNVTFSGNTALLLAGAIFMANGAQATVQNSTIAGNNVTDPIGTGGATFFDSYSITPTPGSITATNTIFANNISSNGNCDKPIASLGYNIDSDGSCGLSGTADLSFVDPQLGPLANNGGMSETMALLPNSRAINSGNCSGGTVTTDQRGISRPQGPACDIGAYELAAGGNGTSVGVSAGGSATTDPVGTGATAANPLQVTVTSPNAGNISIQVSTNNTAPSGFSTLGWQAAITAPTASAAIPLRMAFTLNSSIIPSGQTEKTIEVFFNGNQVPNCSQNNGTATPDPCVATRVIFSNGNVELDVLGSTATNSTWTFNAPYAAPAISLVSNATSAEGAPFVQSGSFTDSASTSWTATVDYGDGGGAQPLALTGKTFALSHTYVNAGTFVAKVSVTGLGGISTANISVAVANVAPVVSAGTDTAITSGTYFTRGGSFTDPGAETWTASVGYGDGTVLALPLNPDKTFTLSHTYGRPGTYDVGVVVTDSLGASGTAAFKVTIVNTPPVVTAAATQTVAQGSTTVLQVATFTDGGALERHTANIDWGDSVVAPGIVIDGGTTGVVSGAHAYSATGSYTVKVTVTDDSGASGTASLTVNVTDTAPSVIMPARLTVNEGSALTSSGSFVDVGTNKTWTATVDYGDGSGAAALALNSDKTFALSHTYGQSGSYTATVTVKDSNGGQSSGTSLVVVNNVAPTVLLGSGGTIQVGATFTALGSFSDPGTETWTATVNYGDGSGVQPLTLNADKTFSLSHQYNVAGSFTVTVVVTDSGGASGTKTLVETVVGTAPTITITAPTNNSTISGLVTVNATVSGNATITGVTFAIDGAQIGAVLTGTPYTVVLDARTLSTGTHTLSATVNSSSGTSMTSISVVVNNSPAQGDTVVDSTTQFSVEVPDNDNNSPCALCRFASASDIIPGQTIEVRRRANSSPAAAAELVLKQGNISGTIASVSGGTFTMQSGNTLLKNVTIQVVTDSSTVLEGFSSSGFAAQQNVVVRGFLYKGSTAGTAVLVAKQVELVQ